jgi:hypothetical protein
MLKYRAHLLKRLLRHNVSHPKAIVSDFPFSDSLSGHFQGSIFVTNRARAFVDSNELHFHPPSYILSLSQDCFVTPNLPTTSTALQRLLTPVQSCSSDQLMNQDSSSLVALEIETRSSTFVLDN